MRLAGLPSTWHGLSRYGNAVRWFVRTLWETFRWRVVSAVAAALVGVIVIGAGMSLSLGYFQKLEQGGEVELGDLVLPARDESTLAVMVIVVLAVLLAGAGILFFAQSRIVALAVELNHRVRMDIALAYGGELPAPGDWSSERAVWRALWLLQTRDARRVSIVARSLLRNTVNLGITVAGIAALFYLEARMTVLFLVMMAVAMVSYYRTNVASARATRRYEAVAPLTRKGLRQLLPSFQTLSQPAPDRDELEAALDQEAVTEETEAFGDRFGAHIHAEFLGFAIMGVALAGLTAFMGREALAGNMPWSRLIAYVLVLRITINGIQSVLRTFAFFSRFYPSIDRLNRFLSASNASTSDESLETLPLWTSDQTLTESPAMVRPVEKGEVVEVVLPVPLSRYSLGLLAWAFAGSDRGRRRRLLGHMAMAVPLSVPPTPMSMRTLCTMNGAWDRSALRRRLGDQAARVEETVGLDPNVVVSAQAWATLPHEARNRLVLIAADADSRSVLALDRQLATRETLEWLSQDGRRVVVVCSSDPGGADDGLGTARRVVVSAGGEILAVGSPRWVDDHWDEIAAGRVEPTTTASSSDDELDDED